MSEKAVYVASLVPTERKMTYLQVDNSQLRASQVFSVVELVANGYDLFDNGEGVIAVAFSSEGGKMTLTLLKTAINEVGGQRLNSNPVSEIKYRRSGNRKLIDLMEVEVV